MGMEVKMVMEIKEERKVVRVVVEDWVVVKEEVLKVVGVERLEYLLVLQVEKKAKVVKVV